MMNDRLGEKEKYKWTGRERGRKRERESGTEKRVKRREKLLGLRKGRNNIRK